MHGFEVCVATLTQKGELASTLEEHGIPVLEPPLARWLTKDRSPWRRTVRRTVVLAWLWGVLRRRRPDLLAINRHVHQKGAREEGLSVLIRCDGGPELGLGHLVRCLALADALRDRHGAAVRFSVTGDPILDVPYALDLKP
ncbi:MAG: hypothetical protein IID48_02815, partial [Proteobacteria bacterium]|nr:hypothetical protein [Pseudomonadota bacterium]